MVHQADALRGGGVHLVARQQEFLGAGGAEHERPDRGAAVARDDPDAHVRIRDGRGVGHEDDVAEQRDRRAESHRRTVQRGDDRHLDVEQVPDDLLAVAAHGFELLEPLELGEPREVAAGAEGALRAR